VTKSEFTISDSLSFEESVKLFKGWGFQVEPDPRPEQVTLIIDAPDHRTYSVHLASMLPQMVAIALRVRMQNGAMYEASHPLRQIGQWALSSTATPLPIGNAPWCSSK
jgi:hypothetical protein